MDQASEEKRHIQENQPPDLFRREKTLFLISAAWWKAWSAYVCYDDQDSPSPRPGPIENSSLLTRPWTVSGWLTTSLREDLQEHRDFEYLTNISWRKLLYWYKGGPAIEVFVVNGEVDLDPVPMMVWAIETQSDYERPKETVMVSKKASVGQVHKYLCDRLSLTYYKYQLRIETNSDPSKNALLGDLSTSIPIHAYILIKSVTIPEIRLPVQQPEVRKTPSSHGDTQDDSDLDMDVLRSIQRSDRLEIAGRIASAKRDIRLIVQDIGVTEKALRAMWMELEDKSDR